MRPDDDSLTTLLVAGWLGPWAWTDDAPGCARPVVVQNADLRDAILDGANMQGANLSGALLEGTSLSQTNLAHASLTGAVLTRAVMREVWGLESAGAGACCFLRSARGMSVLSCHDI
jgi:hypothetical protein